MSKVACSSEIHRYTSGLSCFNNFFIANRTAGLYNGLHAGIEKHLQAIGKGEEGV